MIRRLILAVVAVVAVTTASAVPANASCGYVNYIKFWTHSICMAIGDTGIEAPAMAQQWNVQGGMAIQAANNCVTAGYSPSRRFTIETYDGGNECWKVLGPNGAQPALDSGVGGWWRYTNNPVLWLNRGCFASVAARRHYVSAGIGSVIGLASMNSSGMNSRVVNMTTWSILNVPTADPYSGDLAESIYNGDC